MSIEEKAVDTLPHERVHEIAERARNRWRQLIGLSDAGVCAHVLASISKHEPPAVMRELREAYQDGERAGASDAYLTGIATAATIVARCLGERTPYWIAR